MQHDELIGKVQALAQLPSRGSAEQATRAVLTTLAERVPPGLADHLAAQLPPTLATAITSATTASQEALHGRLSGGHGERFDLVTFTGRVAGRAGTTEDSAIRESTAVLEVLDAAVTPELMEKVAEALPADIRELLPSSRADEPEA
ncbi:DUF2267 domain-containing protein [Streptomyces sp. NPDC051320]|uniref:DUF2267 domain-containing protein n=1 Tax=Streptomyces sp. NPDC051320 TaxID=3154644 RepID=UPI00343B32A5